MFLFFRRLLRPETAERESVYAMKESGRRESQFEKKGWVFPWNI